MSKSLADKLALSGAVIPIELKTFGGSNKVETALQVTIQSFDYQGKSTGPIEAIVMPTFAEVTAIDWRPLVDRFPHLSGIGVPEPFVKGECGLLLGNNCARLIAPKQVRVLDKNNVPVAHQTRLGWSVAGPSSPVQDSPWAEEALSDWESQLKQKLEQAQTSKL